MMSAVFKLLAGAAGPYVLAVAAAVAISGWIFGGLQSVRLSGAHKQIVEVAGERDTANQALGACRATNASLQSSITTQNASLDVWNADGARRLADAEKVVGDAQRARARVERRAAALITTPPGGPDDCARMASADGAVLRALR